MNNFKFNQKPRELLRLDPNYVPIILGNIAFEKAVEKTKKPSLFKVAVERSNKQISSLDLYIFSEDLNETESNFIYVERQIKSLLWIKGGYKIYLCGNKNLTTRLIKAYSKTGIRNFDR